MSLPVNVYILGTASSAISLEPSGLDFGWQCRYLHDYDHGEVDEGATPDAVINDMTEFLEILLTEMNTSTVFSAAKDSQNRIRALLI